MKTFTFKAVERPPWRETSSPAAWVSHLGSETFGPRETFICCRPQLTSDWNLLKDSEQLLHSWPIETTTVFFFKQVKFGVIVTLRNNWYRYYYYLLFFFSWRNGKGSLTQAHSQSSCGWGRMLRRTLFLIPQNIAPEACCRILNSISGLIYSMWWCANTENYGVHFLPVMNFTSSESNIIYLVVDKIISCIKSSGRGWFPRVVVSTPALHAEGPGFAPWTIPRGCQVC